MSAARMALARTAGFALLGPRLGADVRAAQGIALRGGARFAGVGRRLAVFRQTLAHAISNIESDPRGELFQRFLRDGPCEEKGRFPKAMAHDDHVLRTAILPSGESTVFTEDRPMLAASRCIRGVSRVCIARP